MGAVKIAQVALVLAFQAGGFGPGGMGRLAFLDHLFGKRACLKGKFFLRGGEFAHLPFQRAFRRQPGTTFTGETVGKRKTSGRSGGGLGGGRHVIPTRVSAAWDQLAPIR